MLLIGRLAACPQRRSGELRSHGPTAQQEASRHRWLLGTGHVAGRVEGLNSYFILAACGLWLPEQIGQALRFSFTQGSVWS